MGFQWYLRILEAPLDYFGPVLIAPHILEMDIYISLDIKE